jgi:hypothetical protein
MSVVDMFNKMSKTRDEGGIFASSFPLRPREDRPTEARRGCEVESVQPAWGLPAIDEEGKQHYNATGAADDIRDADGLTVFSFSQAQEIARTWFASKARELAGHAEPQLGPFTVAAAVEEYLAQRERKGSKGVKKDRYAAESRIVPTLGGIEASKLTTRRIQIWLEALAGAPKLIRTGKLAGKRGGGEPSQRSDERRDDRSWQVRGMAEEIRERAARTASRSEGKILECSLGVGCGRRCGGSP